MVRPFLRIGRYRRFTANHAFPMDSGGQSLWLKINPNRAEAAAEIAGHARLRAFYPVPALRWHASVGRHTVLVYDRYPTGPDAGLLLDAITGMDATGCSEDLDTCLTRVISHYMTVMHATLCAVEQSRTVGKLYGDRALPGGRLDAYYGDNRPLLRLLDGQPLRPAALRDTTLIVNEREHRVDFADLIRYLRTFFDPARRVWAALTQGDPTDLNIGTGPVWFDYDTAGLNATAGEFACFLWYQYLHGGWLVPTYNAAALHDHPAALTGRSLNQPRVTVARDGRHAVRISYRHQPSPARHHAIRRYYLELVRPLADRVGITDLTEWLRPYLILRILGVHNLSNLAASDAALSLAYLAEVLSPQVGLGKLLALGVDEAHARP